MNNATILVVDDEKEYLNLLKSILEDEGYKNVLTIDNPHKVLRTLQENKVDLILLDVYMPDLNGLDVLENISRQNPQIPVIMVTAVDELEIALKAIKLGAYEFIIKPIDTDRLFLTMARALEKRILDLELDSLRKPLAESRQRKKYFNDIVTNSPQMHRVFDLVEIYAPTNETVLITGETGTGKDLIAKKIHELSPKKDKPYVVVNLASITPSLFESELFGHEKGAFTGATGEKIGYFETANSGTIFLDEIGELPKELQGKLLRTIQYSEIYRIGSPKPIKLDIRIITATNKDLIDAVNKKEFRADLYYRLNRGFIHLPPLRARGDDIILLADHFLKFGQQIYQKSISGFSSEVLKILRKYEFPGNIRELENIVLHTVAQNKNGDLINEIELPNNSLFKTNGSFDNNGLLTIEEAAQNHVTQIMQYANGNVQKAAIILGISERTLQRRLKKLKE
jgi:two-component system, NtrC family, response regulator